MSNRGTHILSRRAFARGVVAVVGAACTALLSGCSSSKSHASDELNEATLFVFDTVVTLSLYCDDEMLQECVERCEYFESIFSRTVENSDVWNINNAAGAPVAVNEETADCIERALGYSRISDGLFDITIGAVSSLWDFDEGVKPSDDAIEEAVKHIDWQGVQVDGTTVTLADPDAMIDLGGIAKGYIADDLKQRLLEAGVESGIIDLGGNVMVLGTKPDGTSWNVGIQDPNGLATEVIASVRTDASVVTSGLYERQFTEDGVRYYHILDPETGYPVETDLVSSSIVSESSTDGDVYATILFLMGHDAALELLDGDDAFEGLVVDTDGQISTSAHSEFELM